MPKAKAVQLGPIVKMIDSSITDHIDFVLPAGATLTYASVVPVSSGITQVVASIFLFRTKDGADIPVCYGLVPVGYINSTYSARKGLVWLGSHKLPEDFEYTLRVSVDNLTGDGFNVQAMCVYLEREKG